MNSLSAVAAPSAPTARVGDFLRKRWVDLGLAFLAASSGAWFAIGARSVETRGGISPTIAILKEGQASRLVRGATQFVPAGPSTSFQNLDAVWTTAKQTATLATPDGYFLELEPATVVTFRKPFSADFGIESRYRVISGRVTVHKGEYHLESANTEKHFQEIPTDTSEAKTKIEGTEIHPYPTPGMALLIPPARQADVSFAWEKRLSGYVAVADSEGHHTDYWPIQGQSTLHASLAPEHAYLWQILDSNRAPILGPFRFDLRSTDTKDAWEKNLTEQVLSKPDGKIDIQIK